MQYLTCMCTVIFFLLLLLLLIFHPTLQNQCLNISSLILGVVLKFWAYIMLLKFVGSLLSGRILCQKGGWRPLVAIRLLFSFHVCWLPVKAACTISPKATRSHLASILPIRHSFMGYCDTIGICVYLFEVWVASHFATVNRLFCLVNKMQKIISIYFYLLRRKKIWCKDVHRCGCD